MQQNVGTTDRVIRIVLGLVLILAPLVNIPAIWSSPVWGYGAMLVGAVLVITALVRMCPLYRLLGIDTCQT